MELNDLIYQQTKLYREAQECSNRKDALNLIHKASRLQDTINMIKEHESLYRYGASTNELQFCGGAFGSDNFIERWH